MEKRVLLAIILSMAVLFIYPYLMSRYFAPEMSGKGPVKQAPKEKEAPASGTIVSEKKPEAPPPTRAEAPEPAEPVDEELVSLDTPLVSAEFTNIGGGVKKWELKKHRKTHDPGSGPIDLGVSPNGERTLSTRLVVNGKIEPLVFKPSEDRISLNGKGTGDLVLSWRSPAGLVVQKRYLFTKDDYLVKTEIKVFNDTGAPFRGSLETLFAARFREEPTRRYYHIGPVLQKGDKILRQKKDSNRETGSGTFSWLGLEDKYFLYALIPSGRSPLTWETEILTKHTARASVALPLELEPNEKVLWRYDVYIGPKEYDRLVKLGLEEAIEFGFFSFLAKPFHRVLTFFVGFLGNYGVAIILLTCIIKVIFYPLTKHSLNSMREMQKIQPQLAAIKQKYKNDREKMNKELMELYKRYKINPLGGCLPMVLQIPVFIALYEVLSVAIELRHAPFVLWITDLSAKDPYYVTPLLMGASMFIQQKMSPTTVDPAQAKVMLMMPVIFTFLFMNFPSGLVLYWLVNNILSIAQQYYIQKSAR